LSVKVKWPPDWVMAASQKLPIAEPDGRSNSTFQPLSVVVPAFVTTYSPENPVPQSETLRKAADGPAAAAGPAATTSPAVTATAVVKASKENLPMFPRSGRGGGHSAAQSGLDLCGRTRAGSPVTPRGSTPEPWI
jgi:hypothetical protein